MSLFLLVKLGHGGASSKKSDMLCNIDVQHRCCLLT